VVLPFKDVVLENTLLLLSVWESDGSQTMLSSILPFTFVDSAIDPLHQAEALPLVVGVLTFVDVSAFPYKLALAVLLIVVVLSYVLVAVDLRLVFLPLSFALFHAFHEVASVAAA